MACKVLCGNHARAVLCSTVIFAGTVAASELLLAAVSPAQASGFVYSGGAFTVFDVPGAAFSSTSARV